MRVDRPFQLIFRTLETDLAQRSAGDAIDLFEGLARFGKLIDDYLQLTFHRPTQTGKNAWTGSVLKVDRFGNLITNITPKDAPMLFGADPAPFKLVVGNREITEIRTIYAEGAAGEVFGIMGSMGFLEIAANRGNAAQITGAGKGNEVSIILGEGAAAGKSA